MILGVNRPQVIENIRRNCENGKLDAKGELDDPELSAQELASCLDTYLSEVRDPAADSKRRQARAAIAATGWKVNRDTEIIGLEKLVGIQHGAFVTCNHFNQLDNTIVRHTLHRKDHRHVQTVIEVSNLALPGIFGFLMNYGGTIPITDNYDYLRGPFVKLLQRAVDDEEYILIYPEQEMWFNYRKPRPGKRGAYYYASKFGKPVISLFVEMQELPEMDDENFHKVRYIVHVLDPLYPDPDKTDRQNSLQMCQQDDRQRREAYEKAYGKPLTYDFSYEDIAGYVPPHNGDAQ